MTLGVIPDELEASSESTGVTSSIWAYSFILKSGRSGAFSWTRSAFESASFMSVAKLKRSRDAPEERPMLVRSAQASSTYLCKLASAFGPGSVATTSKPRARYSAAQLAPMTPVPTIAILRIGLLYDIVLLSVVRCFCVGDAGKVSLRGEYDLFLGAIQLCAIDVASEIGYEHAVTREIERDPDPFHQVSDDDVVRRTFLKVRIHRSATDAVTGRGITAVGPVNQPVLQIELEVNRLGQSFEKNFNVATISRSLAFRHFDVRAKDATYPCVIGTFLRPVKLSTIGIDGYSYAPFFEVRTWARIALACLHPGLNLRTIQVRAHDAHPLAIAPIKLPVLPIECELLGRESSAFGNNGGAVLPIEIDALD